MCRHTDLALLLIGWLLEPFHEPPLLFFGLGLLNFLHKAGRKYPCLSVQQTCPPPIWTLLNDLLGKRGEEEEKGGKNEERRGERRGEERKGKGREGREERKGRGGKEERGGEGRGERSGKRREGKEVYGGVPAHVLHTTEVNHALDHCCVPVYA